MKIFKWYRMYKIKRGKNLLFPSSSHSSSFFHLEKWKQDPELGWGVKPGGVSFYTFINCVLCESVCFKIILVRSGEQEEIKYIYLAHLLEPEAL